MTVLATTESELVLYPEIKNLRGILTASLNDRAYNGLKEHIEFTLEQMTVSELDFKYVVPFIEKLLNNGLYVDQYLKVKLV